MSDQVQAFDDFYDWETELHFDFDNDGKLDEIKLPETWGGHLKQSGEIVYDSDSQRDGGKLSVKIEDLPKDVRAAAENISKSVNIAPKTFDPANKDIQLLQNYLVQKFNAPKEANIPDL
ncbi:MAG: hypothetical protein MRY32_03755 [Rickettsiales bacterium]|nr:hypothetical protein [Rickettsiales bacterium]